MRFKEACLVAPLFLLAGTLVRINRISGVI